MAAAPLDQPEPSHPAGFLLTNPHTQSPSPSDPHPAPAPAAVQPSAPIAPRPVPADPYYGHEDSARLCSRFIAHVFGCASEPNPTALPSDGRLTETTMSLPRFIAYAFHRTRLPSIVAFHALFLLSRLKARYPSVGSAYGHRLFLTSYMLSSKVICDDTYSNKSWTIVGHGFYELRDVNLMEREMIHFLSFDLTIPGTELEKFTKEVRATYKQGAPNTPYVVVPDESCKNNYFGRGSLEIGRGPSPTSAVAVLPAINESSVPSDPPPSYSASISATTISPPVAVPTSIPTHTHIAPAIASPDSDSDSEDSPYTDSSSSSAPSSSSTSTTSCLQTPTDDDNTIGVSNRPVGAKPAHPVAFGEVRGDPTLRIDGTTDSDSDSDSDYVSLGGW